MVSAAEPAAKVLVVSLPRLQWDAVAAVGALAPLLSRSAAASLSIRTADAVTTLPDGYLTIGGGNRASFPGAGPVSAADQSGGGVLVAPATVTAARRDADRRLFGTEPGALGRALGGAGRVAAVVGSPDAALDGRRRPDPVGERPAGDAAVAAFDAVGLRAGHPDRAARPVRPALATVLSRVDPLRPRAGGGPGGTLDAAELTAFAVAGPGIDPGRARSATTRRRLQSPCPTSASACSMPSASRCPTS